MSNGQAFIDDNGKPVLSGYDATGHQAASVEMLSITTDSTTGVKHGALSMVWADGSTSGTVTNNNDAVTLALPGGQPTALIQVTGTFVGTLNFEASPDSGTTYYSVQASVVGGSTLATTATAVGAWRCNISGFTNFRVRLSPATSGTASIVIRLSAGVHNVLINNTSLSVGTALAPYGSNPVQTAASGTDTQYKFGAAGTTAFTHVTGQNNTTQNIYLAFDQSTTISTNPVYTVASGQFFSFDRAATVLHVSSPNPQSFGGIGGITIEAFA